MTEPTAPRRANLAVFVVLGALLAFGALALLSNGAGGPSRRADPDATDPFAAFGTKAKAGKGKAGKVKASVPRKAAGDLWVDGEAVERPAPPITVPGGAPAKNLVLVVWTAVRKDALTPYGAPADRTPFAAELAASGAKFDDLIAASSFSRTSAVGYLTGRHAATVDMVNPGPGPDTRVLAPEVETLAEHLRAAGWYTLGLTANFNLNTQSGLAQGFDRYRNAQDNAFHPQTRIESQVLLGQALLALDARSEADEARPLYLQLDFVDAHAPLRQDKAYADKLDPGTPNHLYRVAVHRLDDVLRDLVTELGSRGFDTETNTTLVLVADHGSGNSDPEHHGKMHGRLLYETLVDAPWIVVGPDVPKGTVVHGLASHTDVMPTLLGLVGLALPADASAPIDGQSWAELVRAGGTTTRTRAFSDTWYFNANRASIWTSGTQCQKDFGSTGLTDTFADGCYDRTTDPEFRNLKQDPALMAELEAWRADVSTHVSPAPPEGEATDEDADGGGEAGGAVDADGEEAPG